jgi:hypothetical protein
MSHQLELQKQYVSPCEKRQMITSSQPNKAHSPGSSLGRSCANTVDVKSSAAVYHFKFYLYPPSASGTSFSNVLDLPLASEGESLTFQQKAQSGILVTPVFIPVSTAKNDSE